MDPKYVSTAGGSEDLHLEAGSPALESGVDLGVTDDHEKSVRPQPALSDPDRGAYEHPTMQLPMAGTLAPGALFVLLAVVLGRVVFRRLPAS